MRKKLLLMMFALLGTVGAWAVQTKTYYVTRPNGTTTNKNGEVTGVNNVTNWGSKFVSEDNVLTFEMSADKINWGFTTSQGFRINTGDLTTILTCNLSVPENHKIISYTFGVSPVNGDANNKGKIDYSKDSNMGDAILVEKESATTEHKEEVDAQTATFYLRHHEAFPVDVTLSVVVESPDPELEDGPLTLTFNRPSNSEFTATVNGVADASVSKDGFDTFLSSGFVTNAILCPNKNGKDDPNITLTFTITGLPENYKFNGIGMHVHAFNSGGGYQENKDSKVRQFNVKVTANNQDFVTYNDIDLAAGVIGSHKTWARSAEEVTVADGSLTLSLNITKGTQNDGCFFGLESIVLGDIEELCEGIKSKLDSKTYGPALGRYSVDGNEAELKSEIESLISNEQYAEAYEKVEEMLAKTSFNMPAAGMFLRLQGVNNKYLTYGNVDSNGGKQYKYTDAEDATTIFYFDGTHLISLSSGLTLDMTDTNNASTGWDWIYGTEGASTVTFSTDSISGTFYVYIGRDNKNAYLKDDGTADRVKRAASASANNGFDWTLTNIGELPISISNAGYATLWTPVALEIPTSGIEAYTGTVSGDYLVLDELTGVIPANTAVILKGEEGSYNFTVTTGGEAVTENALQGGLGLATASDILTLQNIDGVGFYSYDGTGLAGFKAYLENTAGVKGLTFNFGTTDGIATVEGATKEDAAIYNLAGQRVEKAVKGVYIINGKKVLVK